MFGHRLKYPDKCRFAYKSIYIPGICKGREVAFEGPKLLHISKGNGTEQKEFNNVRCPNQLSIEFFQICSNSASPGYTYSEYCPNLVQWEQNRGIICIYK
jgi:hypothetical protein